MKKLALMVLVGLMVLLGTAALATAQEDWEVPIRPPEEGTWGTPGAGPEAAPSFIVPSQQAGPPEEQYYSRPETPEGYVSLPPEGIEPLPPEGIGALPPEGIDPLPENPDPPAYRTPEEGW